MIADVQKSAHQREKPKKGHSKASHRVTEILNSGTNSRAALPHQLVANRKPLCPAHPAERRYNHQAGTNNTKPVLIQFSVLGLMLPTR